MSATRVRTELKDVSNSGDDRWVAFKKMFSTFKKSCIEANVIHEYKKHEYHETAGEKKRRKKRETENQRLKNRLG